MMKNIIVKRNQKRIIPVIWTGEEDMLDYNIRLVGPGAEIVYLMLVLGKDNRSVAIRTNVIHEHPDTDSKVIIKGVLNDASKVDFNGLVKIEHGAKRANAWLAAHLLLLSDNAGGVAVPNLEISENEVKAGHASTVGKVDDNQLFYLMSRGLSEEASKKLIVQGFLESLLNLFPFDEAVKAKKKLGWI